MGNDGVKKPDHWKQSPESLDTIADLTDRQVRNRTLYQLGVVSFALQSICDSVDRVASALEAITSIPLETIEGDGERMPDIPSDPRLAGMMREQKGSA